MLTVSQLRTPIVIEAREAGEDDLGQPNGEWVQFCSTRADIRQPTGLGLVGAERVAGGAEVSTTAYSMRIRWRAGLTAAMRVRATFGGQEMVFEIRQVVLDLGRRKYVDLVCEAV